MCNNSNWMQESYITSYFFVFLHPHTIGYNFAKCGCNSVCRSRIARFAPRVSQSVCCRWKSMQEETRPRRQRQQPQTREYVQFHRIACRSSLCDFYFIIDDDFCYFRIIIALSKSEFLTFLQLHADSFECEQRMRAPCKYNNKSDTVQMIFEL